jgi:hypothetical protein
MGHLERIFTCAPYIFIDNLPSHTVFDSSGEISILPQLPTPQALLDTRELTKHFP